MEACVEMVVLAGVGLWCDGEQGRSTSVREEEGFSSPWHVKVKCSLRRFLKQNMKKYNTLGFSKKGRHVVGGGKNGSVPAISKVTFDVIL